jgi:hypothetical protein
MRLTSTLPLSEGDILHHDKLVYEVYKLFLRQRLGENVRNMFICGYVLKFYCSLLYHVSDEMIFDLNVLRPDQIVMQEASEAIMLHDLRHWLQYTLLLLVPSVIEVCFLLIQDIIVDPKLKQHPKVLFLSTSLHAQSESVYPYNPTSPPETYLRPYPIIPRKYLNTCFVAT